MPSKTSKKLREENNSLSGSLPVAAVYIIQPSSYGPLKVPVLMQSPL